MGGGAPRSGGAGPSAHVSGGTVEGMAARKGTRNERSGSTTWIYEPDKISAARREGKARPAKPARWRGLSRRNAKDKLTVTITYRGGAEAWYLVEARGRSGVFPGVAALHDVMEEIYCSYRSSPRS